MGKPMIVYDAMSKLSSCISYDTLPGSDMTRSRSTSSIISAKSIYTNLSNNTFIDKSSISIHQIDHSQFLQKILKNAIQNIKKKELKKKELKLQEINKTKNIKIIDDNTIAINIGGSIQKNINHYDTILEDKIYENHSCDDTDTDPETAMFDQIDTQNTDETSVESEQSSPSSHSKKGKIPIEHNPNMEK